MKNRYGRPLRVGMEFRGFGISFLIDVSRWTAQSYPR